MAQRRAVWMIVVVSLATGACRSPSPTPRSYTMLRERSVTRALAFAAAEQALAERFRIEVRKPDTGLLRTVPVLSMERRHGGALGDNLRAPRRVRKFVEVLVQPEGDGVTIGCKAVIEENLAGAHSTFERERGLSDIPSDTPADHGAATTAQQDAVWRARGRDKALERDISRAIQELLARSSAQRG